MYRYNRQNVSKRVHLSSFHVCVVIILDLSELNAGESATAIAGVGKSKEVEMWTQSWAFSDPFIGPFTLQCEQRRRQVGHRAASRLCPQEATYSTPEHRYSPWTLELAQISTDSHFQSFLASAQAALVHRDDSVRAARQPRCRFPSCVSWRGKKLVRSGTQLWLQK